MRFTRFVAVVVLVLSIPVVASAGGWAMTAFDELPASFEAGETYELSYTILQHGKSPVDVGESSIVVTDEAGNTTEFQAQAMGGVGRYTVDVTFPTEGTFSWEVSQGFFEPHDLGTIGVTRGIATATGGAGNTLLIIAFALVIALLGVQVFDLTRKRLRTVRAN